jgi:aspartate/methionine/tyrosine aminotransferase
MALTIPNLIIIEDCVYEGFMFDEFKGKYLPKVIHSKHYPLLKSRLLNVYSGGKLLEATGIRCGWVIGQP